MIEVIREQHEVPKDFQSQIARAGGFNIYGEPNFRVVWGWSRLTLIGGLWEDHDDSGNLLRRVFEFRREPKYVLGNGCDRFHVEKWVPPEMFVSPRHWLETTSEYHNGQRVAALGPFPHRGEYEHCWTIQGPSGEFMPLTASVCELIIQAVERSRHMSANDRRVAIDRREEAKETRYDREADDILDNETPAFHGRPFVQLGSKVRFVHKSIERSMRTQWKEPPPTGIKQFGQVDPKGIEKHVPPTDRST